MIEDLIEGAKEIFNYKELFKEVILATMNSPEYLLDKIFPIYEQFYDLVMAFGTINIDEVQKFLDSHLINYSNQPFFPLIAGLYVSALINRILEEKNEISINLIQLNKKIIEKSNKEAILSQDTSNDENICGIGYSLDFIGYLLPKNKTLNISGAVGDYCGALMNENSKIILNGNCGKHLGYEKHQTAKIIQKI